MPDPCRRDDEDGPVDDRSGDEVPGENLPRPERRDAHPDARPQAQGPRVQGPQAPPPAHAAQNPHSAPYPAPHPQAPAFPGTPQGQPGPPPGSHGYPPRYPHAPQQPYPPQHPYPQYPYPPHHPGPAPQQWPPRLWYPQPPTRRSDKGKSVLIAACAAASLALIALLAGVVTVVNTPQEEASPGGVDLSGYRDGALFARPSPVKVDLVEHPLYGVATPPPVECDLPPLDVDSDDSWVSFARESGDCLDTFWAPVMEELGLVTESPEVTVTDMTLDSDTVDSFTLAYYESDHRLITVVLPNVREVSQYIPPHEREVVWLALMGHEYAHHVQQATGILRVSHDLRRTAGDEDAELDTLRRTELQAECMAGIGLRGLTPPEGDALEVVNRHFNTDGDLDTHGTAAARTHWLQKGWENTTVQECNTYGAEPDQVT